MRFKLVEKLIPLYEVKKTANMQYEFLKETKSEYEAALNSLTQVIETRILDAKNRYEHIRNVDKNLQLIHLLQQHRQLASEVEDAIETLPDVIHVEQGPNSEDWFITALASAIQYGVDTDEKVLKKALEGDKGVIKSACYLAYRLSDVSKIKTSKEASARLGSLTSCYNKIKALLMNAYKQYEPKIFNLVKLGNGIAASNSTLKPARDLGVDLSAIFNEKLVTTTGIAEIDNLDVPLPSYWYILAAFLTEFGKFKADAEKRIKERQAELKNSEAEEKANKDKEEAEKEQKEQEEKELDKLLNEGIFTQEVINSPERHSGEFVSQLQAFQKKLGDRLGKKFIPENIEKLVGVLIKSCYEKGFEYKDNPFMRFVVESETNFFDANCTDQIVILYNTVFAPNKIDFSLGVDKDSTPWLYDKEFYKTRKDAKSLTSDVCWLEILRDPDKVLKVFGRKDSLAVDKDGKRELLNVDNIYEKYKDHDEFQKKIADWTKGIDIERNLETEREKRGTELKNEISGVKERLSSDIAFDEVVNKSATNVWRIVQPKGDNDTANLQVRDVKILLAALDVINRSGQIPSEMKEVIKKFRADNQKRLNGNDGFVDGVSSGMIKKWLARLKAVGIINVGPDEKAEKKKSENTKK